MPTKGGCFPMAVYSTPEVGSKTGAAKSQAKLPTSSKFRENWGTLLSISIILVSIILA
jgi:hypothetical protein